MSVLDQAAQLFSAGRGADAIARVEQAARARDPEALHALANWRLYGLYGRRDVAECHRLLGIAADGDDADSIRLLATLTGNGTGTAEDRSAARTLLGRLADRDPTVARELALSDAPAPPEPAPTTLSATPAVIRLDGLLALDECAYLIAQGRPRLAPSLIVDPTAQRRIPHPHRDSLSANFGPAEEDLVVRRINRRIATASGTDVGAGEPLHLLAYDPGQQYRLHLDGIPGAANQRLWTMLLWLSDGYAGGETVFPALDLSVRGRPGDALLFANTLPDGRIDERTRHAGLPVTAGRKWLATRWIRARAFDPFAPG